MDTPKSPTSVTPQVGDRVTFPMKPIGYIVAGTVKSVDLGRRRVTVTQLSGTQGNFDMTLDMSEIKEIRPARRTRPVMHGVRDKVMVERITKEPSNLKGPSG